MVVLSLFDGMSCGQIALRELGIPITKYYASEVDKFAIQNTLYNFPDTVQLGDVRNVDATKLGHVDLLIGGSPCQCFSFAGKRAGMSTKTKKKIVTLDRYLELKQQGFEFEGQSYLFWEYVRILNEVRQTNPDVFFMLENVEMGKQWEQVINDAIGIVGVHINSALVSAQVRKRIYWTNIKTAQCDLFGPPHSAIPQPEDRKIFIKDIIDENVDNKYYLSDEYVQKLLAYNKRQEEHGNGFKAVFHKETDKMCTLTVGGRSVKDLVCVAQRGRAYRGEPQHFEESPNPGKTNCLTTVAKDNLIMQRPRGYNKGGIFAEKSPTLSANSWQQNNLLVSRPKDDIRQLNPSRESGGTQPYQQNRVYDSEDKSPALMNGHGGQTINTLVGGLIVRRLTPAECARLQTIPEWYKWNVSETRQYRMLGNGWTVEVVKHILSFLPESLKR
ncbi:MAG: DNA (cytosine-5-)-methyltransferase [bacterium]|nr:DNA (cytosine-5-)-methyltransferase [bacterium]